MTGSEMSNVLIRPATTADIPHIVRIYAPAVETGSSSFELEPPDAAEIGRRMKYVLEGGYPYLAAEVGGRFAGYATPRCTARGRPTGTASRIPSTSTRTCSAAASATRSWTR